jgi:hypothetical protein
MSDLSELRRLTRRCGSVTDGGHAMRAYRATTYLLDVLTDVEDLVFPVRELLCSVVLMPAIPFINRFALRVTPLSDDTQALRLLLSCVRRR